MEQKRLPFSEDEVLHLVDVAVQSAGTPKDVGHKFKPDMDPEDAGKWIKRCVNPSHKDQLYATHYIRILMGARYKGNHEAMNALLAFCGYVPNATPQSAENVKQACLAEVMAAQQKINETFERMDAFMKRERGEW